MLPNALELAPGLTYWSTHYPEWGKDVGCVALDAGQRLVLIDPLVPADTREARRFWKALDGLAETRRSVDVIVTLHYHRRSAPEVVERYRDRPGAAFWAPRGSLTRLRVEVDHPFEPGDRLPAHIVAHATGREDEVVLWLPAQRALVSGDVLLGGVRKRYRICPPSWLPKGVARVDVARALAPLLELPVELLVPLHGPPLTTGARTALEEALAEPLR